MLISAIYHRSGQRPVRRLTLADQQPPAGSSHADPRPDGGATSVRRQNVRRANHAITSAARKTRMGLSATAAFAANHDWSGRRLSMADRIFRCGQQLVPDVSNPLARG